MKPRKYQVKLKKQEKEYLEKFTTTGVRSAREITRAKILLLLDKKLKNREIIEKLAVANGTITKVAKNYHENKLKALKEKPRPGGRRKVFKDTEAAIIALACTDAPDGRGKWTIRLLQDKIIQLGIVESISHTHVLRILKKANLNLGSKNNGVSDE